MCSSAPEQTKFGGRWRDLASKPHCIDLGIEFGLFINSAQVTRFDLDVLALSFLLSSLIISTFDQSLLVT